MIIQCRVQQIASGPTNNIACSFNIAFLKAMVPTPKVHGSNKEWRTRTNVLANTNKQIWTSRPLGVLTHYSHRTKQMTWTLPTSCHLEWLVSFLELGIWYSVTRADANEICSRQKNIQTHRRHHYIAAREITHCILRSLNARVALEIKKVAFKKVSSLLTQGNM